MMHMCGGGSQGGLTSCIRICAVVNEGGGGGGRGGGSSAIHKDQTGNKCCFNQSKRSVTSISHYQFISHVNSSIFDDRIKQYGTNRFYTTVFLYSLALASLHRTEQMSMLYLDLCPDVQRTVVATLIRSDFQVQMENKNWKTNHEIICRDLTAHTSIVRVTPMGKGGLFKATDGFILAYSVSSFPCGEVLTFIQKGLQSARLSSALQISVRL